MASKNTAKKKESLITPEEQQVLDRAYVEGKTPLLLKFLQEHSIAIQPVLEYTDFGIRPNVKLVKYEGK